MHSLYEPCFICSSCIRTLLHLNTRGQEKHWILPGCHPPLPLFSEGSQLPNPWACLTIPLPRCRTPTPLFWSQGILDEKSLLTSNCYHLGSFLSFPKKKKEANNDKIKNPIWQRVVRISPMWIMIYICSDEAKEEWKLTVAQCHTSVPTADCSSLQGFYLAVWFLLTSIGLFYNRAHLWTKCVTT